MNDTKTTETPRESNRDVPRTVHRFPGRPEYRLSGSNVAQPGDRALCGFVKKNPAGGTKSRDGSTVTCAVCLDLMAAGWGEW